MKHRVLTCWHERKYNKIKRIKLNKDQLILLPSNTFQISNALLLGLSCLIKATFPSKFLSLSRKHVTVDCLHVSKGRGHLKLKSTIRRCWRATCLPRSASAFSMSSPFSDSFSRSAQIHAHTHANTHTGVIKNKSKIA